MAEQLSRKRRVVKRAIWSLVAVLCLIASYLGSYVAFNWYWGHALSTGRELSVEVKKAQRTAFAPIILYERTDWPCARTIAALKIWALNNGKMDWDEAMSYSEENYQRKRW
jgi:hypothetical protein